MQSIQMQLSKNKNLFFDFFLHFFEFWIKFENFGKEDDPNSLCISEVRDFERHA